MPVRVGEDDVAIGRCHQRGAIGPVANDVPGTQGVVAGPSARQGVAGRCAVHYLGQPQKFGRRDRGRVGRVDHFQVGQGLQDGPVGHITAGQIVVLAAFERDGAAALRAHVFGGAHAVARVGAAAAILRHREIAAVGS